MTTRPRRHVQLALATTAALALAACGGGSFDDGGGEPEQQSGPAELSILIGSSGPAETDAVTAAAEAWSEESGNTATVTAAQDLNQQLSQGFAAGSPPDVFYVSSDLVASYAENGSIEPYAGDLSNADDFYPNLRDAFTVDGEFYCAPKDFSTLSLIINTDSWAAAGLTDDDVPTTWEELSAIAEQLTTAEQAGLTTSTEYQRLGAFMAQAGGSLVTDGEATANSPENVEALEYVQSVVDAGAWRFAADLDSGWAGEAFGTGRAAMTIEGNWMIGAMAADYPDINYQVAPLPEGPSGAGTLTFTNCWGIAAESANVEAAIELVEFLTSTDQQLEFASAFGVMPSVQSAADQWRTDNPDFVAFLDQAENAVAVPNQVGVSDVVADLNAQLEGLGSGDPQAILESAQSNLEAIL
ncbi:MAG: ABC transporter substrate-binding protein [Geodermatophilaceae bacterium]|nr:ABC transporter substrate-binding protein [Geodermatophilaceae bacterium]MDQ3454688.1 ABC transporter substrate-binding protein [Actinomycetota bacterium]